MSIFRESFKDPIKTQLVKRQDAMLNRTAENIQYINSRNAWVRMASSVNVNGSSNYAKAYVLHGGTLNDGASSSWSFKTGIGGTGKEAYSTKTPYGTTHKLGIRPMPGITSVDVKSKSAYGSLREVTVNFQCWDIHQLEELELLYMRPGYTVLVEWGWVPYLDNKKGYTPSFNDFYSEILLNNPPSDRSKIFKALYQKSLDYDGNYDAMFGYIKNYSWSARPDGGYDCQTVVISTGEIIESLKVNYVRPDLNNYGIYEANGKGFLNDLISDGGVTTDKYRPAYEKNTLAGIWSELWHKIQNTFTTYGQTIIPSKNYSYSDIFKGTVGGDDSMINPGSAVRVYITLESVFNMLNEYIIARSNNGTKEALIRLSTNTNTYSSNGEPLYCVAHPLQVSTDPLVCLIKNPDWESKILNAVASTAAPVATAATTDADAIIDGLEKASASGNFDSFVAEIDKINSPILYKLIDDAYKAGKNSKGTAITNFASDGLVGRITKNYITNISSLNSNNGSGNKDVILPIPNNAFGKNNPTTSKTPQGTLIGIYTLYLIQQSLESKGSGATVEINLKAQNTSVKDQTLKQLLQGKATPDRFFANLYKDLLILDKLIPDSADFISSFSPTSISITPSAVSATATTITLNASNAVDCMKEINTLKLDYFYGGKTENEIGKIGNIYICLDFLYKLATSNQMESQDGKEKNEINLYSYVKGIASGINSALGSVNNFEVHVDPVDNIGRIIDVNYCEPNKKAHKLHEFKIQTLDSVVRNFKLESRIFPNQSSIVAIGAQASGGQLGMQNNTMVDYNSTLKDRVISEKTFPKNSSALSKQKSINPDMASGLASIVFLLATMKTDPAAMGASSSQLKDASSRAKNGLRDLIVYFQNIVDSPSANRNIIPTKLSFDMDGIGGLVIGQLFTIDQSVLPRGYKGLKGGELARTITGISHTISDGDWKTSIDSLAVILDNIKSGFSNLNIASIVAAAVQTVISQGITPTPSPTGTPGVPGTPRTPTPSVIPGSGLWPVTQKDRDFAIEFSGGILPAITTPDGKNYIVDRYSTSTEGRVHLKPNPAYENVFVPVTVTLASGKKVTVTVHKIFAVKLQPALDEITRLGLNKYIISTAGGRVLRNVSEGISLSPHAWGISIDINSEIYGWKDYRFAGSYNKLSDFDKGYLKVVDVMHKYKIAWYKTKDPMHFSVFENKSYKKGGLEF